MPTLHFYVIRRQISVGRIFRARPVHVVIGDAIVFSYYFSWCFSEETLRSLANRRQRMFMNTRLVPVLCRGRHARQPTDNRTSEYANNT